MFQKYMSDAGRPSELTEELTTKIRRLVLDGWKYIEIQAELGISSGTWDHWVFTDYQGFRANLRGWKQEKMLKKAEEVMDGLVDSVDEEIQFKSSKFLLETLDKDTYSKRVENTGKGGEALIPRDEVEDTIKKLECDSKPKPETTTAAPTPEQQMAGDQNVVQLLGQ